MIVSYFLCLLKVERLLSPIKNAKYTRSDFYNVVDSMLIWPHK